MPLFTTNPLPNLFGSNPFSALQDHMQVVLETVSHVPELIQAVIDQDADRLGAAKTEVFRCEEEADELKHKLREHLPRSLFLPVDRRDLLDIVDLQDAMADKAQDIAGLLVERRMTVPDALESQLHAFVARSVDACVAQARVVQELDELLATGFGGREAEKVGKMMDEVNAIEDESDRLGIALTSRLFEIEESLPPVSVVFWFHLIQWIGELADYAEKSANRTRLILAH